MKWKAPSDADAKVLWDGINNNSEDRVVAIVCAAYMEAYLEGCLRLRLQDRVHSKLFDPRGALSTQSAKIDLAEGIGLLSEDAALDLAIIARIRNRFAHNLHVSSFEHQDVKPLCGNLRIMPTLFEQVARTKSEPEASFFRGMHVRTPPRLQFTNTAGTIANFLSHVWAQGGVKIADPYHIAYWSGTWTAP